MAKKRVDDLHAKGRADAEAGSPSLEPSGRDHRAEAKRAGLKTPPRPRARATPEAGSPWRFRGCRVIATRAARTPQPRPDDELGSVCNPGYECGAGEGIAGISRPTPKREGFESRPLALPRPPRPAPALGSHRFGSAQNSPFFKKPLPRSLAQELGLFSIARARSAHGWACPAIGSGKSTKTRGRLPVRREGGGERGGGRGWISRIS